jgi:hypothetical protein
MTPRLAQGGHDLEVRRRIGRSVLAPDAVFVD